MSENRREFIQKLGMASIVAGSGLYATNSMGGEKKVSQGMVMSNTGKVKIYNGNIITPYRTIANGTIVIEDGIIKQVGSANVEVPGALEIDAKGLTISPGFIDLHVHGGGGHSFLDGSVNAFLKAAELHAMHGTTSMYPTALSGDKEELYKNLEVYERANKENTMGAQFLGVFLEGPYYSMEQKGAQNPKYIRNADPEEYKEILSRSPMIKRWDSAPEREGGIEFIRYLKSKGVLPSMGHTSAVYEDVLQAFENGCTLATHLYSGMTGVIRKHSFRFAGGVESAFLIDEMNVEVIADGKHLPPSLLKLIYRTKGPDRIALVTDSIRAAGMPDGEESILGSLENGIKVIVEDGVAKLPDRTSFAGSVATTDRLVRNMVNLAGAPLCDAVRMASITPANIMGVSDTKGSLVPGKDADIVIFNDNVEIAKTIVKGRVVYDKEK